MKKQAATALFALLLAALALHASADQWVFDHYIEIVCPFGVGGGADNTLQVLAPLLQGVLDTEVKVINVAGNGGGNAADYAMELPADGHSYLLASQSMVMSDLQGKMATRFREEFVPVARLLYSVDMIVASKAGSQGRFASFEEMLAYGKAHPGELSCGVLSQYGADYVALSQALEGVDVQMVPYDQTVELGADLISGKVTLMVTGAEEVMGLIDRGEVIPMVALYSERLPMLPDVPCTAELGIDCDTGVWRGLFARKDTPPEAIEAMNEAIVQAIDSRLWNKFLVVGSYNLRPGYCGAEEFERFMDNEYGKYAAFFHRRKMLCRVYGEED